MTKYTTPALLCLLTTALSASDGPPVSVESRAKGAQLVVVAAVENVYPRFGANQYGDQVILSDVQLNVAETLKGRANTPLAVTVEGGRIGELALHVSDMPVMQPGERAVFFLDSAASGFVLHQRGLGVMKIDGNEHVRDTTLTVDDVRRSVRAAAK
jgi:hypothetical protein